MSDETDLSRDELHAMWEEGEPVELMSLPEWLRSQAGGNGSYAWCASMEAAADRIDDLTVDRRVLTEQYKAVVAERDAALARIESLLLACEAADDAAGRAHLLLKYAREQRDAAHQALWDIYAILGFDTDGDATPGALVAGMGADGFLNAMVEDARKARADSDELMDAWTTAERERDAARALADQLHAVLRRCEPVGHSADTSVFSDYKAAFAAWRARSWADTPGPEETR